MALVRPLLLLVLVCIPAAGFAADSAPPRWYAGFALGTGAGDARVEGARLEFGRGPLAVGLALRAGRVLRRDWHFGFQIDAVGAGSGDVVVLTPAPPVGPVPATTTHRVAINHYSLVGQWFPAGGPFFVRAGPGLAESFTEDWDSPGQPVTRDFGPGLTAGAGYGWRLDNGARISLNADGLGGRYGGRTGWGAMVTLGLESF